MAKKYHSEEDVKSTVEKKMRKPVTPHVWGKLVKEGYIKEVLDSWRD